MADYIYFVRHGDTDMYKIGVSKHPKKRLQALQSANPCSLSLCITIKANRREDEKDLHEIFKDKKIRKRSEWFTLDKGEFSILNKIAEAISPEKALQLFIETGGNLPKHFFCAGTDQYRIFPSYAYQVGRTEDWKHLLPKRNCCTWCTREILEWEEKEDFIEKHKWELKFLCDYY